MQYGTDPKAIKRYAQHFIKLGAVFEEKDEQAEADSWKDKSVEADGCPSAGGDVSIEGMNFRDSNELVRDSSGQAASVCERGQLDKNNPRRSYEVGKHVMGLGGHLKFASHRAMAKEMAPIESSHKRNGGEQAIARPAAVNQEEEKKAVPPQQLRRDAIQAADIQVQAQAPVIREPANANVAQDNAVRIQVAAEQHREAQDEEETDEMIDRFTRRMCDRSRMIKADQKKRLTSKREIGSDGASKDVLRRTDLTKKRVIFK